MTYVLKYRDLKTGRTEVIREFPTRREANNFTIVGDYPDRLYYILEAK